MDFFVIYDLDYTLGLILPFPDNHFYFYKKNKIIWFTCSGFDEIALRTFGYRFISEAHLFLTFRLISRARVVSRRIYRIIDFELNHTTEESRICSTHSCCVLVALAPKTRQPNFQFQSTSQAQKRQARQQTSRRAASSATEQQSAQRSLRICWTVVVSPQHPHTGKPEAPTIYTQQRATVSR